MPRVPTAHFAALILASTLLCACPWGYGAAVDQSRFASVVLSDDRDTVVWSYHELRYRPASGWRAFPDGGIPKYLDDEVGIGVLQLASGESRVLWKQRNRDWAPGHGEIHVQQVAGRVALVGQGGQLRDDFELDHRLYLLDTRRGHLEALGLTKALARRGRAKGHAYLVRDDGLLVLITPSLAEKERHLQWQRVAGVTPEIWLRLPGGALRRVAASHHYEGFRDGGVHYWSRGDRLHRRYDVATGETRVVPDPRFAQASVDIGVGLSSDRRGLELQRRSTAGWSTEPLAVDNPF